MLMCTTTAYAQQAPVGKTWAPPTDEQVQGAPKNLASPWYSHEPKAHMFSALAAPLKDPASQDVTDTWGALVHQDLALMSHVYTCMHTRPILPSCAKTIGPMVIARQSAIKKWMPLWRMQLARTKDPITKDHMTYQVGVAHMLLGEDIKGLRSLKSLIERVDETPYGALAMASVGDYYWRRRAYKEAQVFYLRAASSSLQSIHPYAQFMQGMTSEAMGDSGLALQAMSLSYSKLMSTPEQLQFGMLAPYVLEELAPVYAMIGQAKRAPEYIAQFNLAPQKQRAWLTRLASAYQSSAGNHPHAMTVYERLAYGATPRQQAFYIYGWIQSRRYAAPRVDEMWVKVMNTWMGLLSSLSSVGADAAEVELYRYAAVEEQRRCVEQTKLRPELARWCVQVLKTFVTTLPRSVDSEEMLFEYAALSANQGDMGQARWAWRELLKIKDSVYRRDAVERLKKVKKIPPRATPRSKRR